MYTRTIAELLIARLGDDHPGLTTREQTWSWDQVVRECADRGSVAQEILGSHTPHIGILLDNVPEYIFWLGGAALTGATIVGINSTHRGQELARSITSTDCQVLVTDSAGLRLLDGLDFGIAPDRVVLIDDIDYASRVSAHSHEPEIVNCVEPATQLLLLLTSGTTGAPKAARCSQGRLASLGEMNSAKYSITRDDISYCPMPLFHGNALMSLFAPTLVAGGTIALPPQFSASSFIPDVRYFGATFFTYVGKAIAYILAIPRQADDMDNRLTHGYGTEASPEDRDIFLERFGCTLIEGYGSSEGAGSITLDPQAPAGALGRPAHPGIVVVDPETLLECPPARLDEHGRVVNAEEAIGEMINKVGAAQFEGYYKNPEADADRVRNGMYWTGDLGYLDEAGFLYFAGRSGDWIRVDGENVSALLTERILTRHPDIQTAAVFSVPDPRSGDQVMAALELRPTVNFEDLGIPAFLEKQPDLGPKSVPRFIRTSYALPSTASNKLRKKEMQRIGWRTDDEVHRWVGRSGPTYSPMLAEHKAELREEFIRAGRARFLP
ncbi:AMP-binding protein [Rhodococcus globerulus]|uniref:AMP-binding protein n=1 Tax=Rhodococcus globerulus TaxID=33008 RepID=UPI003016032E